MVSIKLASNSNFANKPDGANVIPYNITGKEEDTKLFAISVVNDYLENIKGTLAIDIMSFSGKILASQEKVLDLPFNNNTLFYMVFGSQFTIDKASTYVRAKFTPSH